MIIDHFPRFTNLFTFPQAHTECQTQYKRDKKRGMREVCARVVVCASAAGANCKDYDLGPGKRTTKLSQGPTCDDD